MGKNTWLSLPKRPLPNRFNIIVSTTINIHEENVITVRSIEEGMASSKSKDLFVIGGAAIYRTFLYNGFVDRILMTRIHNTYTGTVYFPDITEFNFKQSKTIMSNDIFDIIEYTKS
jgi:dihydrofolate reductase